MWLDLDLTFITGALELAVFDILDDPEELQLLRKLSTEAYEIFRVLPSPVETVERMKWLVRTACLGVLADRGSDVSKFLKTESRLLAQETSELWGLFPISGVVFAHYTYPEGTRSVEMPPEDFWNIAGRAGRVDQDRVGIIAFASPNDDSASRITNFVQRNVSDLNSTLIQMVNRALEFGVWKDIGFEKPILAAGMVFFSAVFSSYF